MQELPADAALLPAVHVVLLRRAALGLVRRYAATHLMASAAALLPARPRTAPWPWLPAGPAGPGSATTVVEPSPSPPLLQYSSSSNSVVIEMFDDVPSQDDEGS